MTLDDEPLYTEDESVYDADLENSMDSTCYDGDDPMDSIDASNYL